MIKQNGSLNLESVHRKIYVITSNERAKIFSLDLSNNQLVFAICLRTIGDFMYSFPKYVCWSSKFGDVQAGLVVSL